MNIQPADLVDRGTILILKLIHQEGKREEIKEELLQYLAAMAEEGLFQINDFFSLLIDELDANASIWRLESAVRKDIDNKMPLEEVGRRAVAIRGCNKIRIDIKNKITELLNKGFVEVKIDHASS
jgi:hypothetical protein